MLFGVGVDVLCLVYEERVSCASLSKTDDISTGWKGNYFYQEQLRFSPASPALETAHTEWASCTESTAPAICMANRLLIAPI